MGELYELDQREGYITLSHNNVSITNTSDQVEN